MSYGPILLPTGPIHFGGVYPGGIRVINDDKCLLYDVNNCLYDGYKFIAQETTVYYAVFTANTINHYANTNSSTIRITVFKNPNYAILDEEGIIVRDFHDSSDRYNNEKSVTFSYHIYLLMGEVMWLDSREAHSLMIGPPTFQCEWSISRFSDTTVHRLKSTKTNRTPKISKTDG